MGSAIGVLQPVMFAPSVQASLVGSYISTAPAGEAMNWMRFVSSLMPSGSSVVPALPAPKLTYMGVDVSLSSVRLTLALLNDTIGCGSPSLIVTLTEAGLASYANTIRPQGHGETGVDPVAVTVRVDDDQLDDAVVVVGNLVATDSACSTIQSIQAVICGLAWSRE